MTTQNRSHKKPTPTPQIKVLHPDAKGRVAMGDWAKGASSFSVEQTGPGTFLFIKNIEIPERDVWIFENKEVLSAIDRGMAQSLAGKTTPFDD